MRDPSQPFTPLARRSILAAACLLAAALPPAVHPATIYHCKTYSGAVYWSENACGKSSGVMVDMVQVPDGMPFKEQVKIGERLQQDRQKAQSGEDKDRDRQRQCSAIDREIAEIEAQYKNGRHLPADQVSSHQNRMRDLRSQRSRLNCQSR